MWQNQKIEKLQGQYSEKDNLTGLNEFELRMYNARFGRWVSPDPYGQYFSPYIAMGNNPHFSIDPNGGISGELVPKMFDGVMMYVLDEVVVTGTKIVEEIITQTAVTAGKVALGNVEQGFVYVDAAIPVYNQPVTERPTYVESPLLQSKSPQGGVYNIDKAVNHLNTNAITTEGYYGGSCVPYVPNAINAGFGVAKIPNNKRAALYGEILKTAGFTPILDLKNYSPIKGDIAVIQGYPGGTICNGGIPCGHIQMYNGDQWVSDFYQSKKRPIYPGPPYELKKPTYEIFRWIK